MTYPNFSCQCGCRYLERVKVDRPGHGPYVTEFIACTNCRIMFHVPEDRLEAEDSKAAIMAEVRRINSQPKPRRR